MRKVVISQSGNVGFIDGPGAKNLSMEFTIRGEIDPVIEEVDASRIELKFWNRWKKDRDRKRVIQEIRKEIVK